MNPALKYGIFLWKLDDASIVLGLSLARPMDTWVEQISLGNLMISRRFSNIRMSLGNQTLTLYRNLQLSQMTLSTPTCGLQITN